MQDWTDWGCWQLGVVDNWRGFCGKMGLWIICSESTNQMSQNGLISFNHAGPRETECPVDECCWRIRQRLFNSLDGVA